MTNKEIANQFKLLGDVSLLLGENQFKARSYQSAYQTIRQSPLDLETLSVEELEAIKGIGKNTALKIKELIETGVMEALESKLAKVPSGVLEILQVKGLGAKKVQKLWQELDIMSLEELQYACQENRLLILKGFGEKSQADILAKINYQLQSRNAKKFSEAEALFAELDLKSRDIPLDLRMLGQGRRKCNVVDHLEIALLGDSNKLGAFTELLESDDRFSIINDSDLNYLFESQFKVSFYPSEDWNDDFAYLHSIPEKNFDHWNKLIKEHPSEKDLFASLGYDQVYPELYDQIPGDMIAPSEKTLIEESEIKGLVHYHTNYSDGRHTLKQMADSCIERGMEYMVVTDHSKSAFYANGLDEKRIHEQHAEIDELNRELENFKIFKGIESDILPNGSLDYEDEILDSFDVIIASVHSVLKMDKEKATKRIISAIENPYTTILGHPTGRLLLGREGYPLDHIAVIEACAANKVDIELNASPYRLDIDWQWIPLCMELGVNIFINPDAHDIEGISYLRYGVFSARKGGLIKSACPNTLALKKFENYIRQKKERRLELINNI